MTIPKRYFHDRSVLLLISVNTFLAIATCSWFLLRLNAGSSSGYIVQYRGDLGINAFKTGSETDLLSFLAFIVAVLIINILLSIKIYHIHRQLSVVVLALTLIILVTTAIVSNALLVLR